MLAGAQGIVTMISLFQPPSSTVKPWETPLSCGVGGDLGGMAPRIMSLPQTAVG